MSSSKANTYRAVLIGLAIIIIAFVVYFIYRAIVGTKHVVQSSPTINAAINPAGAGQQIRENAPISNQPASAKSGSAVIPVNGSGSGSGSSSGSYGVGTYSTGNGNGSSSSGSGGTVSSGQDTANYGPPNGSSFCNGLGSENNPACQQQQVYPK